MQRGQPRMRVAGVPEQGVRIDRRRIAHRDAPQVVAGRPDQGRVLAEEGRHRRGLGDRVQEGLDAEVRADRVHGEPVLGRERVVVGRPLGARDVPGHPDALPGELPRGHRPCLRERVGGPGEQLQRLVEDRCGLDAVGQPLPRHGDAAERRVDGPGADGGDGGVRVGEGDHVEVDVGTGAVEVTQQTGRRGPSADHVHPQRTAPRPHRGDGPLLGVQQRTGVRQERLPVDREPGPSRGPGEQRHPQLPLQRGDPLGHALLGDGQPGGGDLELARLGDGDEGAYGAEIHDGHRTSVAPLPPCGRCGR